MAMTAIVAGGIDHGRIVAYQQRDGLPPGTEQALERVAIVAALTITKELAVSAVEGKFRGDYLRDVLTGQLPVDEPVVQHCRSLGWDIDRPMVVLVAELDAAEPSRPGVAPAGRRWCTVPSTSGSSRPGSRCCGPVTRRHRWSGSATRWSHCCRCARGRRPGWWPS